MTAIRENKLGRDGGWDIDGTVDQGAAGVMNLDGTTNVGGTIDLDGTVNVDGVSRKGQLTYTVSGVATVAQINAGHIIVPAVTGRTPTFVDGKLQAVGGAVGAVTTIDVADTASTPVRLALFAQAGLTQNTVVHAWTAGAEKLGAAATASKGLQLIKAGSDITTATHVRYSVSFTVA